MQLTFESADDLAHALERAADAHGRHEEQIGHEDPDWPAWYAEYLHDEQVKRTGDAAASAAEER
jgi:hypothetical protein